MKFRFYFLGFVLALSFNLSLTAQITSSTVPITSTANPSAYAYDAQTRTAPTAKLSKRERQRFQRSLARRADDLADWDLQLENREKALNGRRAVGRPALSRNPLPARLLSEGNLYAWESRLDRLADRLSSKDAALQLREQRVHRHRRIANARDRHNSRNDQRYDTIQCREQCCSPKSATGN